MADQDRVVVVTGGTGGLGEGVVARLVEAGRRVVVTWVVETERDRTAARWGERVELRQVDVLDAGAVDRFAQELFAGPGCWGVAHLVGGYLDGAPLGVMSSQQWARQMELNLTSLAVVLGAFVPRMASAGGGRFVGVGSRAGLRPFAGASAYVAAKAAVPALVGAASEEVKERGVCVNAVLPSVIDTPANRAAQPDADPSRWVRPDEIGSVVAFLLSEEASAVTGAAIPVYGRA